MSDVPFNPAPVMKRLKDFQRATAEYVFRRLYEDHPPARRFLVADEVGLGKTLVARGVIANALQHLHHRTDRIDIIYICSNAAIARQNIARLNVYGSKDFAMASRLTLLPLRLHDLKTHRVNFVSFTPGTTFDLKSSGGVVEERALLFRMLEPDTAIDRKGLSALLRCGVKAENWSWWSKKWGASIDGGLAESFRKELRGRSDLYRQLVDAAARFGAGGQRIGSEESPERYRLVGALRQCLASTCLAALEPDLVILDEFQRFRDLLDGRDEAAELARSLFTYTDARGNDARVLLLSATPYKMLSLDHEADEDHYKDFLRTVGFLLDDPAEVEALKGEVQEFRRGLYGVASGGPGSSLEVRRSLQRRLGKVMCRTERIGVTSQRDAMLEDVPSPSPVEPDDLDQAAVADQLARSVGAREPIEYWKSSPYLPSFLRRYELRDKLERIREAPTEDALEALTEPAACLLRRGLVEGYGKLDPGNARMRFLFSQTLERGLWQILWLPPSLPYTQPSGAFADLGDVTKQLAFSSWNLVPDAISAVCSYEAERRMLEASDRSFGYSQLYDRQKPLLRFNRGTDGRLTGMPALALLFPAAGLADLVDPLRIASGRAASGPPSANDVLREIQAQLRPPLVSLLRSAVHTERPDERWYWAAPALLTAREFSGVLDWSRKDSKEVDSWLSAIAEDDQEIASGFRDHLAHLADAMAGQLDPPLGTPPEDLLEVISELALGAPGIVALRALRRVAVGLRPDHPALLAAAARVAWGFRTLFNLPESILLLRSGEDEEGYWRLAVRHGIEGNLQALLDEQVHVLKESLGLQNAEPAERVRGIAEALASSLSIRAAPLRVDEVRSDRTARRIEFGSFNIRCRFALRFGELRDERDKTLARVENVRDAFNSPFRPFILATTSIGQEGLDFHVWCHSVVHWNLPSNPVDLEQREGRVQRYKGHAVRKNVARKYGLAALSDTGDLPWDGTGDPWEVLFDRAQAERPAGSSDLVPYWVFETPGGARVQRRVPLLPLSREVEQIRRLKRSLALYRLVFGQPRQEDLLAYLVDRMSEEDAAKAADEWRICLDPKTLRDSGP